MCMIYSRTGFLGWICTAGMQTLHKHLATAGEDLRQMI